MNRFFRNFAIMYRKTITKAFSVALAFLMLASTLSFAMEKHFCGDTLIDVAIFTKVESCAIDMEATPKVALDKNNCCKEELEIVKGQDQLKKASFEDLDFEQHFFITTLVSFNTLLFEGASKQAIPHNGYAPPNLVTDIQVLDQVFII